MEYRSKVLIIIYLTSTITADSLKIVPRYSDENRLHLFIIYDGDDYDFEIPEISLDSSFTTLMLNACTVTSSKFEEISVSGSGEEASIIVKREDEVLLNIPVFTNEKYKQLEYKSGLLKGQTIFYRSLPRISHGWTSPINFGDCTVVNFNKESKSRYVLQISGCKFNTPMSFMDKSKKRKEKVDDDGYFGLLNSFCCVRFKTEAERNRPAIRSVDQIQDLILIV